MANSNETDNLGEPGDRARGVEALGEIGHATDHMPTLLAVFLRDASVEVSLSAAQALIKMGPAVVLAILNALNDGGVSAMRLYMIMDMLARLRPLTRRPSMGSADFVAILIRKLVNSPCVWLRILGKEVVNMGDQDAAGVIQILMAYLGDKDTETRLAAAWALTNSGPAAVPALRIGLESKNSTISARAKTILKRIGA